MSEKRYTDEQMQKLNALKEEWLKEAEPFLAAESHQEETPHLDGPDTHALVALQKKYMAKMQEISGETQERRPQKMKKFSQLIMKETI